MQELSPDDKIEITRSVMRILDEWEISGEGIIRLLGLPEDTRNRHLEKYRHKTAFPDDPELWRRLEHVIGIADALRTTYPLNGRVGVLWLHKPHRRFRGRTPIQIMVEGGLNGMHRVRSDLDCSYAWDRSGSQR